MHIAELHHTKIFSHFFSKLYCARIIITDHDPITVIVRPMYISVVLLNCYFQIVHEVI